jgi:hypothetical protein
MYSTPDTITVSKLRRRRWVRHWECMREFTNAENISIGKSEVKRPLRISRLKWKHNIKMYSNILVMATCGIAGSYFCPEHGGSMLPREAGNKLHGDITHTTRIQILTSSNLNIKIYFK